MDIFNLIKNKPIINNLKIKFLNYINTRNIENKLNELNKIEYKKEFKDLISKIKFEPKRIIKEDETLNFELSSNNLNLNLGIYFYGTKLILFFDMGLNFEINELKEFLNLNNFILEEMIEFFDKEELYEITNNFIEDEKLNFRLQLKI